MSSRSKHRLQAVFIIVLALILFGCGGETQKTQDTPEGTVNLLVERILDKGDLENAFKLLNPDDLKVVKSNPSIGPFISEDTLEKYNEYSELLKEYKPRLLKIANTLLDVNVRGGEIKGDSAEVKVEVIYPSDYMTLMMVGMSLYNKYESRFRDLNIDSISLDQKKKILWTIVNDLETSLDDIKIDKKSTYLLPLTLVKKDGKWWIDLQLSEQKNPFDIAP